MLYAAAEPAQENMSEDRGASERQPTGLLRGLSARLRPGKAKALPEDISPFFRFLLDSGIPEDEVLGLLNSGKALPSQIEPILLRRTDRDGWLAALGAHYETDFIDLRTEDVSPTVALVVPEDVARAHNLTCIAMDEDGLTLAMSDPEDRFGVTQVEQKTDFRVTRRVVCLSEDLAHFLEELYGSARTLEVSPREIIDEIIKKAILEGASDIHIEPLEDDISIRFRQDGMLIKSFDLRELAPRRTLLRHLKTALPVVVKNKSGASGKTMNIAENQKPQDGRIYLPTRSIDMRVSILPCMHGESIVIRIHRPEGHSDQLARLGFGGETLRRFQTMIQSPYGMILVSGPTGSGKTTTLYTVLRMLNSPDKKLLTVEDPIEYAIPDVIQVQTNTAKGVNFASALRSFLRHDPDIIMVGEIRDSETAVMAVEASLTGHLVLSTIHANDAVRTITRIKDLGVNPLLITSTCLGTLAQRLVRTNCPDCLEPARYSPRFYQLMERFQIPFRERDLMHGVGCQRCSHTGYRGRTAIHELMMLSAELRELILTRAPDSEIENCAREQGMRLLVEDALHKVAQGLTTEAEVLRVTLADTSVDLTKMLMPKQPKLRVAFSAPEQPVAEAPSAEDPAVTARIPQSVLAAAAQAARSSDTDVDVLDTRQAARRPRPTRPRVLAREMARDPLPILRRSDPAWLRGVS